MRIACPACDATYDVPDQMLGSGRKVRCSKCGHQWMPAPAPPIASTVPPITGVVPPIASAPAAASAASVTPPPRPIVEPELPRPEPRPSVRERLADRPRAPANPPPMAIDRITDSSYAVPEAEVVPATERGRRAAVWLGWLISLVIWGLVIWAGYHYRAEIMAAWPPSQRLYVALGLGPGS